MKNCVLCFLKTLFASVNDDGDIYDQSAWLGEQLIRRVYLTAYSITCDDRVEVGGWLMNSA